MAARTTVLAFAASCFLLMQCAPVPQKDAPLARSWQIESPDQRTVLSVVLRQPSAEAGAPSTPTDVDAGAAAEALFYRVERDGLVYLDWSPLGVVYEDESFVEGLEPRSSSERPVQESYEALFGKRRLRSVNAAELVVRVANTGGAMIDIVFRAHDDGISYRYVRPGSGPARIVDERSGFTLPANAPGVIQPHAKASTYTPAYERAYRQVVAGEAAPADADGWSFPALFEVSAGHHALISEAALDATFAGSRLHGKAVGSTYTVRLPSADEGAGIGEVAPTSELPWATPWRLVMLGETATVVESTLVEDLSPPPSADGDFASWVKPGRGAWSWWSQDTGSPELQREYIDSAAEFGWEYALVDANWDRWPDAAAEIAALSEYARTKNVRLWLWYNSGGPHNEVTEGPRDRMHDRATRQAELAWLVSLGIAGIKVDFFHSDKQDRIRQYLEILEDAALHRLLVNFHGCTLPRGWQRTYPNLVTMEGVLGAESYRWNREPSASQNVLYAYLRNVVGSMDYTPITFEAALRRANIAYVHELALSVVYESGVQFFADRADSDPAYGFRAVFAAEPAVASFLGAVPAAWDDTRFIAGAPPDLVILARQHGADWYLAGITGDAYAASTEKVALGFLGEGDYAAILFEQGDEPSTFAVSTRDLASGDTLDVTLASRSGFVARFVRQ
jgi:hypothetical protein